MANSEKPISFKNDELFIYRNGDSYELGKVKRKVDESTYFCYYHSGETSAKTPVECMHKLVNAHVIQQTTLGGI